MGQSERQSSPRQPDLTQQAAAAFVRRHGGSAAAILGERAELAAELGHRAAADTWRAMAAAAARLPRW